MNKSCKQCQNNFEITDEDLKFYDRSSPIFAGVKCDIPVPDLCPKCRHQRRLAFRNERNLYHRKSDLSDRNIISIYAPDKPYKVYDQDEWWSDKWDPMEYGFDYTPSKTFEEQFNKLMLDVPHMSLYTINVENSYYNNYGLNLKNCYLLFGAGDNEDCLYGKFIVYCRDCVDNLSIFSSELCYQGIASEKCYGCRYFTNSRSCNNCTMIEDMSNCSDCICCFGLRSKKFYFKNEYVGAERYNEIKKEYEELTQEKTDYLQNELNNLKKNLPHVDSHIYHSENCTGDSLYNCKNCHDCFDCKDCEDSKYLYFSPKTKNTYDCVYCAPDGVENCYNVCSIVNLQFCMSDFLVWIGNDIYYSVECHSCDHLFGCVGLKKKSYCIFNKQYSKEDYEKTVLKIIQSMQKKENGSAMYPSETSGTWGEYLPYQISPFGYNETEANVYFPLNKEDANRIGAKWYDNKQEEPEGKEQKQFTEQEIKFYKKINVDKPTVEHNERHYDRVKKHSSISLFERTCDKCNKIVKSIYPQNDDRIVYCENCYLKTVY